MQLSVIYSPQKVYIFPKCLCALEISGKHKKILGLLFKQYQFENSHDSVACFYCREMLPDTLLHSCTNVSVDRRKLQSGAEMSSKGQAKQETV